MAKAEAFDAAEYLDTPEVIAAYLSEAFEAGDDGLMARALGTVARIKGMKSKELVVFRENLDHSFSTAGKPELGTVMKVLDALDVQLVARPKGKHS